MRSSLVVLCTHSIYLLSAIVLLGCGEAKPTLGPEPFPVAGRVTYKGQPAVQFRVMFHPVKNFAGASFSPAAVTDENGDFALHSYSGDHADGAPPGEYLVTFQWPDHINTNETVEPRPEIDRLRGKFNNPHKTKWKVQVVAGENELETFELN